MLILEPVEGPLTILPTHRVLLGLDADALEAFSARLPELFEVEAALGRERAARRVLVARCVRGRRGSVRALDGQRRRRSCAPGGRRSRHGCLPGGAAVRRLDVTLASVAIERLAGIDPAAVAEGRIAYTMSAAEALAWVDAGASPTGRLPASAALLLDPTPAAEIVAVAADGDVMPQKSTYIYPKALTGLVINPLE